MTARPASPPGYAVQSLSDLSTGEILQHYEELTFPPISRRLAVRPPPEDGPEDGLSSWLGAVALGRRGPVGLVLALGRPAAGHSDAAQVVSLAVHPGHRGRRIGSSLLAALEGVAADAGARAIEGAYRTSWRSRKAIEAMLGSRGWSPPETRMILARGESGFARGILRQPAPELPPEAGLFSWETLSEAEAEAIVARQSRDPWYPEILTPFQDAPRLEPTISVGLRVRGEVAGWMICHRVSHDTLQYSAFYLRDDLRGGGLGFALLREAVRRRLADPDIRHAILAVDARNRRVRAWVEERFRPFLASTSELRVSRKTLGD
jgi:GNAT superfamily N-acetyltransferase